MNTVVKQRLDRIEEIRKVKKSIMNACDPVIHPYKLSGPYVKAGRWVIDCVGMFGDRKPTEVSNILKVRFMGHI